jgi:pimeloyl-ACP methyl ester carboxylesterase
MTPATATNPAVVEAFAKAVVQVEGKLPTGPQLDMMTMMPMRNPRLMPVPPRIIHGEYNDVADLDGLLPFFQQLSNPYMRCVVIPNAGHMRHLKVQLLRRLPESWYRYERIPNQHIRILF